MNYIKNREENCMNTKYSDKNALKFNGNIVNHLVFTTKLLSDNINPSNKSDEIRKEDRT